MQIDGVDATYHSAPIVTEIFRGMIGDRSFDVSEFGMTYFLRTFKNGESPFVAIPVFPNRAFRHSAIFVHEASGIEKPEDLNGKTIGELALYSHDAGIMPKGVLMDEFGFKPETCRWVIGGLDWPLKPIDFVPHTHPANVEVTDIATGKELGAMLDSGEIDALISADVPKCMLEHSSNVRRLFVNYQDVERDYYRRTGISPIMHTVVMRRDLLARRPELAQLVFKGFCEAKKAAEDRYTHGLIFNSMGTMFPWFSQLVDDAKLWMPCCAITRNRASPAGSSRWKTSSYRSCWRRRGSKWQDTLLEQLMKSSTDAIASTTDFRYPIGRFQWPEQVTPEERREWIRTIEKFPKALAHSVFELSDEQLDTPYRPGGWTIRQVVHHLADSHLNSYARYRLALTEHNPAVRGYDEKAWAELPDAKSSPVEPSLALLGGLHDRWTVLLQQLSELQWARTFEHSERGPMRLDATTGLYAWHGEHHLAQIRSLREREDW